MPDLHAFNLRPLILWLFSCLIILGLPSPAKAALVFCNRTQAPLEAALAYRGEVADDREDWISEGWWHIEPGQCSRVFGKALEQRFYFYYAMSLASPAHDHAPYIWSGDKYKFCIDTKAFRIIGDGQCDERSYQLKGFQQIDLGANVRDYTLDFKDGG
jgi:hypothetical protein